LTASPGGLKDKIEEVKENLHIEAVEVRTEKDGDVAPYIQETEVEKIFVELPKEFKDIRETFQKIYNQKIYDLLKLKVIPSPKISKKDLLAAQRELGKIYSQNRDWNALKAVLSCAQAIKVGHAIELIETQGISPLKKYLDKLVKDKKSSASKRLMKDSRIKKIIEKVDELHEKKIRHPKLEKLLEIVKEELKKKKSSKIIVFANYRDSVEKIAKLLEKEGIEIREFYGQAKKRGKGLSQKEQIEIINEFELEIFNVLIATSVAEEGLSIPAVDIVIFYEPVASEIRTIQRRGRTGRTEAGKVIFLITKDTRDEWYFWSAYHKEKRMKRILKGFKEGNNFQKKKTIKDFLK
jgi:Fanconi anemia group M protein